jgi:hypothetical protein
MDEMKSIPTGKGIDPETGNFTKSEDQKAEPRLMEMTISEHALGEELGGGSHARVYILKGPDTGKEYRYVVKIGELEDYSPPILKALKLSFNRQKMSDFLVKFLGPTFKIMPDLEYIKNGLAEYLLMKNYFSPKEPETASEINPELSVREALIQELDNKNSVFCKDLPELSEHELVICSKAMRQHSADEFLPNERMGVGPTKNLTEAEQLQLKAEGKELQKTYFIIQERVLGNDVVSLSEITDQDLARNPEIARKLLAFALLTKKMYLDTGKLIDMRPEELAKNPFEWFQKTANLLVNRENSDVKFVDTRWLWDKKSPIGKKWFNLIDWLGSRSVNRAIKRYAKYASNDDQER